MKRLGLGVGECAANSLRAMCTAHAPLDDDEEDKPRLTTTGYGYGMFTGIFAGRAAWYHPGDNPGYQSLVCRIPDLVGFRMQRVRARSGLGRSRLRGRVGRWRHWSTR
jgi:hypothetical protein